MDEQDLQRLTASRPLLTREIHPFNAFYGHDRLLKRFAGVPDRTVLKLSIEHGLPQTSIIPALDRALALPMHLCQTAERAALVERELPGVEAVPIGPLIRYAELPAGGTPERRARVVLFPAHSVHTGNAEYDVDAFVEETGPYRDSFDEAAVCLYWRDVQLGRAAEYARHGLDVVTAGHLYDPLFLPRLRDLLAGAAAIVTNEVGTHVVYAALLECAVWIVPQSVEYRYASGTPADELASVDALHTSPLDWVLLVQSAFADPRSSLGDDQRALVREIAGDAHVKSPTELRELIAHAEAEYASRTSRAQRVSHRAAAATRRWRSQVAAALGKA
jgi:hypothetical protein